MLHGTRVCPVGNLMLILVFLSLVLVLKHYADCFLVVELVSWKILCSPRDDESVVNTSVMAIIWTCGSFAYLGMRCSLRLRSEPCKV